MMLAITMTALAAVIGAIVVASFISRPSRDTSRQESAKDADI